MAGPTVTLTFAGDSSQLQKSFDRVGDSAQSMSGEVGKASNQVREYGRGFDRAADASDAADTRAMGFRDTITGVSDSIKGFTDSSLSMEERLLMLGMGVGDLASGLANFLIPGLKSLTAWLRVGLFKALSLIAAHPIIATITLLAGLFVLLWTNSETFRDIVISVFQAVWGVISSVAGWIWGRMKAVWSFLTSVAQGIGSAFMSAFRGISSVVRSVVGWIGDRFRDIGRIASSVGSAISSAFKGAFNFVASIWNNTVGSLSFSIPSWVPVVGGNSLSMPKIPTFHDGGEVPGAPGSETLALLQAGETVLPTQNGAGVNVSVSFGGNTDTAVASLIMRLMRTGQIQIVGGV